MEGVERGGRWRWQPYPFSRARWGSAHKEQGSRGWGAKSGGWGAGQARNKGAWTEMQGWGRRGAGGARRGAEARENNIACGNRLPQAIMTGLRPLRLSCTVQNYEWGRIGNASEVGRLYALISQNEVEEDKPYAELWMGTHESGHSLVILEPQGTIPLKEWLVKHPEALGEKVVERWGIDLPFLFKDNDWPLVLDSDIHCLQDFQHLWGKLPTKVGIEQVLAISLVVKSLDQALKAEDFYGLEQGSVMPISLWMSLLVVIGLMKAAEFHQVDQGSSCRKDTCGGNAVLRGTRISNSIGILFRVYLHFIFRLKFKGFGALVSCQSFVSKKGRVASVIDLCVYFGEMAKILLFSQVLSVGKALSIQAHPDKDLACRLHEVQSKIYKDSNHKPEMALALTEFEALCGFVSAEELKDVLQTVPEIESLLGDAGAQALLNVDLHKQSDDDVKTTLRAAFTQLMTISKEAVAEALLKIKERLNRANQAGLHFMLFLVRTLTPKEQLVLKLEKQYPDDIGVISAFFFNYVKLGPGEALFLDANEPHAYLYGECVECMATSDNVVRAGLTPKYRDVQTLCSMLTYKQGLPEILQGLPLNTFTTRYSPPFHEFEVDRCILPTGTTVNFPAVPGPSVFLILYGEGVMAQETVNDKSMTNLRQGDIFFVPARIQLNISAIEANEDADKACDSLHLYRAGVNSRVFE
eukprot:Gb_40066 [translate_table: standard]